MKAFQGFACLLSSESVCKNLLMQLCKSVRSLVSWLLRQCPPLQDFAEAETGTTQGIIKSCFTVTLCTFAVLRDRVSLRVTYHVSHKHGPEDALLGLTHETVSLSVLSHCERALWNKTFGNSSSLLLEAVPGPALAMSTWITWPWDPPGWFWCCIFFRITRRLMQLSGEAWTVPESCPSALNVYNVVVRLDDSLWSYLRTWFPGSSGSFWHRHLILHVLWDINQHKLNSIAPFYCFCLYLKVKRCNLRHVG